MTLYRDRSELFMNSRLKLIEDWPERAHAAGYSGELLAQQLGYSQRQLERYIMEWMAASLKVWLNSLRQQRAAELLCAGHAAQVVAVQLGYKQPSHFTRAFKKYHGMVPSQYAFCVRLTQKVGNG